MKLEREQIWVVLPLTLAVAPLMPDLPYWVGGVWLLCAVLRLSRRDAALSAPVRVLLAALVLAGILAEFRTILGPQGGVALLVGMSAMKLLETSTARDRTLMVLIGYFLLLTTFIHGQSLPLAVYQGVVAIALTGSLIAIQPSASASPVGRLKLAARMLAQALPLAVLMFVLFPRIPAPFGGLAQIASARTGLSDSMSPGSFNDLILSDEVAFRVEFDGRAPAPGEMYWRGPVLWIFDGRAWRQGAGLPLTSIHNDAQGRALRYTVTLEPHRQRWLFTLGLPDRAPDIPADATPDFLWLAKRPVTERLRYRHGGFLDYRMDLAPTPESRELGLRLPAGYNPKTRDLIDAWKAEGLAGKAMVDRALAHFRDEPFYYTLRPPGLGVNSVDDFLFGTRRGFCEHYSSAFVVLMRMAGLPARIVTGYQGGELNALGNYWVIRQRDAHAWTEVWLPERGWIRVDPTAAVAPERVERGIAAALPAMERPASSWDYALLRPIGQAWDLLNTRWNRWVLGYDNERQRSLLSRLHPMLSTLQGMLWAILVSLGIALGLVFWSLMPRRRSIPVDELTRLYARFRQRLTNAGLVAGEHEGPMNLAKRIIRERPDLADEVRAIALLYIAMRYGHPVEDGLARLRARIRRFRP